MKKFIVLIVSMLFTATSMFAQWDIEEGFEGGTFPPTGWTVINNGGTVTWERHTSSGYSHTGVAYAYLSDGFGQADDWLITPQISVQNGDKMYFWARMSYITEYFNVKLSTTGNAVGDFTVTLGSETITSSTYIQYEYDLSSYPGNVYLAIQGVTSTSYQLFVDDVKVGQDPPPPVINIPADYTTIQEGLDVAGVGYTVLVSAGTYYENLVWPDTDGIILLSETGVANTIIDGSGLDRVIHIPQACTLTNATVIDCFTIQNGNNSSKGPGGGIADYCGTTIRNNIIKNNSASGVGGGLHLALGNPFVFNNLIIGNTSNDCGGGIYIFCGAEIRNNTITGNTAT
ncbi:MAG: choice-of-anchor J domain-containing protein, partial [Bacteroidales bacterium]|nr:choice-of-anchor J domain-containing protein [Bacteroidales bacterium]